MKTNLEWVPFIDNELQSYGPRIGYFEDNKQNMTQISPDLYSENYQKYRGTHNERLWVKNGIFQAKLQVLNFYRGRSATHVEVFDVDRKRRYIISMADFIDLVKKIDFKSGMCSHQFVFCKKGSNYFITSA